MKRSFAVLVGLLVLSVRLFAVEAIAVSADGSTVLTGGGYNLYQHDPETLDVIKRTRIDQGIQDLALSSDGKIFFCAYGSFDQTVTIRETATGKGCVIYRYAVKSDKLLSSNTVYICPDDYMSPECAWVSDGILIYSYSGINALINEKNEVVKLFKAGGLGYGMGVHPKGTVLAKGSMIHLGYLLTLKDLSLQKIEGAAMNPGFPEYYNRIVFDKAGNMFGLTGANRIFRVNKELKMYLVKPVL